MEIALILARPYLGQSRFGIPPASYQYRHLDSPALHRFRLVCKTFASIGKQAIILTSTGPSGSPYAILHLPPKRRFHYQKLAKMFEADGGALAKLITTVCINLVPSGVSGSINDLRDVFQNSRVDELPKDIYVDNHWTSFLTNFPNISHLKIDTTFIIGGGLEWDFEAAWELVRSVTSSSNISSATLKNYDPYDSEVEAKIDRHAIDKRGRIRCRLVRTCLSHASRHSPCSSQSTLTCWTMESRLLQYWDRRTPWSI